MKKFKSKADALQYCMDNIKPSIIGLEAYNRFRQMRARYKKDPSLLKENGITNLFEQFGIEVKCTYYLKE